MGRCMITKHYVVATIALVCCCDNHYIERVQIMTKDELLNDLEMTHSQVLQILIHELLVLNLNFDFFLVGVLSAFLILMDNN